MPMFTETYHLEWQFGHIEYDVPKALGTPLRMLYTQ